MVLRLIGRHFSLRPSRAAIERRGRVPGSLELLHRLRWYQRRAEKGWAYETRPHIRLQLHLDHVPPKSQRDTVAGRPAIHKRLGHW